MQTSVLVLRGGPGAEHEVSLKTGAAVLEYLREGGYRVLEAFIDRTGVWHVRGVPISPERALSSVDVVFNALHGQYGEDGTVQRLLDRSGIPYTGSGAYASALAMNKAFTNEVLAQKGIRMPRSSVINVSPDLDREITHVFRSLPLPLVVKPASSGSSVGVTVAQSFDQLVQGVKEAFSYSPQVIVQEFIKGKEATVGVIDNLRNERYYVLPAIEIVPPAASPFFDYAAKYNGATIERSPGNFTRGEAEELARLARAAHEGLNLRHYSRSDFIVSPKGIYYLETNTLPGLTRESLLPKALGAVGISMPEFIDHLITQTLT